MKNAERLAAQQKLTIAVQALETEAHRLGCHIGAHSLNRAKNAIGWEMAGDLEQASIASEKDT